MLRLVTVLLFFGGLAALEVASGLERWFDAQARHREDQLDLVDRQQEALGREVADHLGAGTRHGLHLAKHPAVRALLAAPDEEETRVRGELLARVLRPYVISFPEIDGVSVLDPELAEVFRCERMGGGVASLPYAMLASAPGDEVAGLFPLAAGSPVAVSPLVHDQGRVEVAESERWVFHLVTGVDGGEGPAGAVVVTIYAAPMLHALEEFKPVPGTSSCLLDDAGEIFASEPSGDERGGVASLLRGDPGLVREIQGSAGRIDAPPVTLFVRPTGAQPASRLVSAVPEDRLVPVTLDARAVGMALRSLLVLAVIGFGSAMFVRTSLRAQRLRETETYLARIAGESRKNRALMEAAADLILIVDPDSERVEDWNPQARALLAPGATTDPAPSLAVLVDRMEPDDAARLRRALGQAARRPGEPVSAGALRLTPEQGGPLEVDARCVGIGGAGSGQVEIALADRTREREMERRAHTAERLSSLGLVAAGVAHEINNPLEGIANYLSLLERAEEPERRAGYLAQVRRGFQRIREITGELLPMAREERGGDRAELRRVVDRVVDMARLTKDFEGLQVDRDLPPEPVEVRGGEGRVEQVVLNLLLNAGRVMEGKGTIRVTVQAGDRAEVRVEDEGPGIAPEDLEHLFDPFFSRTGGTGLGLSVSYGIAKALGGDLIAEHREGGGARFRFLLPRAEPVEDGATHEGD